MEIDDYKSETNSNLFEHYSHHFNRLKAKEAYLKKNQS